MTGLTGAGLGWLRAGGWRWLAGGLAAVLLVAAIGGGLWLVDRHLARALDAATQQAAQAAAARTVADVNRATAAALAEAVRQINTADEARAKRLERVRTITRTVIHDQTEILAGPAGDRPALDALGVCLFNQGIDLANGDPVRLCPGAGADVPAAEPAGG